MSISQIKKLKNYDYVAFLVLFMTYFNFLNQGTEIFTIGCFGILAYLFFIKKRKIDKKVLFLLGIVLAFSVSYQVIDGLYIKENIFKSIHRILTPALAVLFGYFVMGSDEKGSFSIEKITIYLLFIILVSFCYGALDMLVENYHGNNLLIDVNSRKVYDVWAKIGLAATLINSKFFLATSLIPVLFLTDYKNKKGILFSILLIMFCVLFALKLGSRTFFIGLAFNLILTFIILYLNKFNLNFKRLIKICLFLLILVSFILIFDLFNLRSLLFNSFFIQRISENPLKMLFNDPRIEMWVNVIVNLPKYPLGGYHNVGNLNYAHNLWLDIAYSTGVIPLLFFIILTINLFRSVINLLSIKSNNSIFIFSFIITLLFLFFMEPIIAGYYTYFLIFFLLIGALSSLRTN